MTTGSNHSIELPIRNSHIELDNIALQDAVARYDVDAVRHLLQAAADSDRPGPNGTALEKLLRDMSYNHCGYQNFLLKYLPIISLLLGHKEDSGGRTKDAEFHIPFPPLQVKLGNATSLNKPASEAVQSEEAQVYSAGEKETLCPLNSIPVEAS